MKGIIRRERPDRLFWAACLIVTTLLLAAGCRQDTPTPTPVAHQPAPPTATRAAATATPRPTQTPVPSPSPSPTQTPEPTNSSTPTATLPPSVSILVIDSERGEPLPGAAVRLAHSEEAVEFEGITNDDGQVIFEAVVASTIPYTVEITLEGYQDAALPFNLEQGQHELTVDLILQVLAEVTADPANLRSGPGAVYPAIGQADQSDLLVVLGQSEDGQWLLVQTVAGEEAWLALSAVTLHGQLNSVAAVAAPATPTPRPTAVAAVPPPSQSASPSGPNLLINPGFEHGTAGWQSFFSGGSTPKLYAVSDYPQFIHTGNAAAVDRLYQHVSSATPGSTYRFGIWSRLWSSTGEDRTVSQEPGPDVLLEVCINTSGDAARWLPTTVCSRGRPLDTWQFISVDAVALTDRLVVILFIIVPQNSPRHNEAFWDDGYLGLAPAAATPTPGPPARPAPVAFDAGALRDSMAHLQWALEQMGGLLDRAYNGEAGSCTEYSGYYRQVIEMATYHTIPSEWQSVYDAYIWATDHSLATNLVIYELCRRPRPGVSQFQFGLARSGIFDSLARLIPAIGQANALISP